MKFATLFAFCLLGAALGEDVARPGHPVAVHRDAPAVDTAAPVADVDDSSRLTAEDLDNAIRVANDVAADTTNKPALGATHESSTEGIAHEHSTGAIEASTVESIKASTENVQPSTGLAKEETTMATEAEEVANTTEAEEEDTEVVTDKKATDAGAPVNTGASNTNSTEPSSSEGTLSTAVSNSNSTRNGLDTNASQEGGKKALSTPMLAAVVVGGLLGAALLVGVILFAAKKLRQGNSERSTLLEA